MINNPSRLYPKAFYQQQLKRMGSIFEPIDLLARSISVKRILRKYGYPPDKQEKATMTVLQQAELIAKDWTA